MQLLELVAYIAMLVYDIASMAEFRKSQKRKKAKAKSSPTGRR
jgi:hypothetical protein